MIEIKCCNEVFENDYLMMSRIVLPLTLKDIFKLRQSHTEKYLRYYVGHRLEQYMQSNKNVLHLYFIEFGKYFHTLY